MEYGVRMFMIAYGEVQDWLVLYRYYTWPGNCSWLKSRKGRCSGGMGTGKGGWLLHQAAVSFERNDRNSRNRRRLSMIKASGTQSIPFDRMCSIRP